MGEPGYPFAIGLAVLCGFAVYAVRAMPKPLAFIGMAAGIALMILDVAQLRSYAWPVVLAFFGFGLLAGAAIWGHRVYSAHLTAGKPNEGASILVECIPAPFPAIVPSDGYIPIVGPHRFGDDNLTISTGGRHGVPGEKWDWPSEWAQKWSTSNLRCTVTNYAATPIFNVELPVTVAFLKIERQPDNPWNFNANKLLGTRTASVQITKIDSGKDSPYFFYIQNQGRDALQIQFSETPTYVALGETERRNATLLQPAGFQRLYHLWSVRENESIVSDEEKEAAEKQVNKPQSPP